MASGLRTEVTWTGDQAIEAATAATVRGLLQGAEHIRGVAVNRTPIDTGDLRNSATAQVDEGALTGAVSYDTPYAVRQHEGLGFYHFTGQSKFLETAANEEIDTARALLAAQLRRAHRS